jgi:uncharacterized membrane protein (DUF373 family)
MSASQDTIAAPARQRPGARPRTPLGYHTDAFDPDPSGAARVAETSPKRKAAEEDGGHYGTGDPIDRASNLLETVVGWAEMAVGLVLAAVIIYAVAVVIVGAVELMTAFPSINGREGINGVIKAVLDTFIIIELFRITIAYVRHHEVVPTVLETALVVAAREIVVIEAGANNPLAAAAVGGTLLAIGITSFLLTRAKRAE